MKTIKLLPAIDITDDEIAFRKYKRFEKTYESKEWGNKIGLPEEPRTFDDGINFAHILFINFWQSLCKTLGDGFYLHPDFSLPSFKIEGTKDKPIMGWHQTLFKKRNDKHTGSHRRTKKRKQEPFA